MTTFTKTSSEATAAVGASATGVDPGRARPDERAEKRRRIIALLDERRADSLLLTSSTALGWYLAGGRTHVSLAGDPVVQVRIDRDADTVVTTSNEVERLLAEELPDRIELEVLRWDIPLSSSHARSDGALVESDVAAELRAARASLLPGEVARYRRLGRDAAGVLTDVLTSSRPDDTERQIAARVTAGLVGLGAEPLVTLVAGESRLGFRHPLPTAAALGRRSMIVVCARRDGLITNLTRWVRSPGPEEASTEATQRLLEVEAGFFAATRVGARTGDVFDDAVAGYARHGFPEDEWQRHHQGGAAGYAGRDPRATSSVDDLVAASQAWAWNPSASGVKVEDTVLIGARPTDRHAGASTIEVLTADPDWPTVTVHGVARPTELER